MSTTRDVSVEVSPGENAAEIVDGQGGVSVPVLLAEPELAGVGQPPAEVDVVAFLAADERGQRLGDLNVDGDRAAVVVSGHATTPSTAFRVVSEPNSRPCAR